MLPPELRPFADGAPDGLDLTDPAQLRRTTQAADALRRAVPNAGALADLERAALRVDDVPLLVHVAVKLARSRVALDALPPDASLTVVFAVYKEHRRILRASEHPHGEDFLRRKAAQLAWLFADRPGARWALIVVDDGCPEGSGGIADEIAADEGLGERVRVLLLADAIAQGHPAVRSLRSTDDSRKGASIQLGLWEAAARPTASHVVAFTDADLSTHLGQAGLLMAPVLGGASCAAGSRRGATSVVVKKGGRNTRGKLFIYLWKRLVPALGHVVDTQCGFKAFDSRAVRALVTDPVERGFAFDIELMLRAELARAGSVRTVPIAWIDSEAESTTTDLQPYLTMLRSVVAIARRYGGIPAGAEGFADLVESLDEPAWQRLAAAVPEAIAGRDPAEFADFDDVSADQLRASSLVVR